MAITLGQAKNLERGTTVYSTRNRNPDGSPQRCRVTSVKTWKSKRNEHRVEVRLAHGLYRWDVVTERDLDLITLTEDKARGVDNGVESSK